MPSALDLTGHTYSRLRVVSFAGNNPNRMWHCYCECGTTRTLSLPQLRSGNTKSCGCLRRELVSAKFRKHHLKGTPEYTSWQMAKDRCYNPKNKTFSYYGGRGITMCDRWLHSPQVFVGDMGLKPSPSHTVDRVDGNGNYEPSNCRWANKAEQSRNRKDTVFLTYKGVTKPQAVWAEIWGLSNTRVCNRMRRGWSIEKSLETPLRIR